MTATAREVARAAAHRLAAAGIDTAPLDAEVLMRHVLGLDRTAWFLRRDEPLAAAAAQVFADLVARRLQREPVAYLVGEREFLGLPFAVGPGALVPRPETEVLVEWAAHWLAGRRDMRMVDVGTGSGAIAVGLARLAPADAVAEIVGIDPSPDALRWAELNRAALAPDAPIRFVRGSLLEPIAAPVDLVLANLPYLTPEQLAGNPDLAAEPATALVSGADGLDLIRALLADLPRALAPTGAAILELDPDQAAPVADLARAILPGSTVAVVPDLSGRARFVTIEREPVA